MTSHMGGDWRSAPHKVDDTAGDDEVRCEDAGEVEDKRPVAALHDHMKGDPFFASKLFASVDLWATRQGPSVMAAR